MHNDLHSSCEWRSQDVPILITPPQEECLPQLSPYPTRLTQDGPVSNQPLSNPPVAFQSHGELSDVFNLSFDLSDPECDLSAYGSVQPSPVPSPSCDTFGFEEDSNAYTISCRRDSFAHSDTSDLNDEINNMLIQDLAYTNFPNFSTDALSSLQPTYVGRARSASCTIRSAPHLSEAVFSSPSPYASPHISRHSISDLSFAAHTPGMARSRANSLSSLPPHSSIIPLQPTDQSFYPMLPGSYAPGPSPSTSPAVDRFPIRLEGSAESLPALSSSYGSYQSHGYQWDSNGSSTEYLSLDDSTLSSEYFHHSNMVSYNISDLSTHPYPMKGKRSPRSHICHFCQRPFTRKHDLHRHIRVHTGDKPYRCDLCGKTFARTDALKRHFRVDEECGKAYKAGGKSKEESVPKAEDS